MTSLEAAYCQWLERMALAQRACQESKRVVSSYQSHGLELPQNVAQHFTQAHEALHRIAQDFPDLRSDVTGANPVTDLTSYSSSVQN